MAGGELLFGGTFDPIHVGHLIVARHVREQLGLPCTVLIPAAVPPHKQDRSISPAEDRLQMTRLAVLGEQDFGVDDQEIQRGGPSFTIETIESYVQQAEGEEEVYWLIGSDTIRELNMWHRIGELADACSIVVATRPGFDTQALDALVPALSRVQIERIRRNVIAAPLIDLSSTLIRRRVAEGRSIRHMVPDAVADYIAAAGLYRRGK